MHPDFFTRVQAIQELSVKLGEPSVTNHDILVSILSGGLWAMEHELGKSDSLTPEPLEPGRSGE